MRSNAWSREDIAALVAHAYDWEAFARATSYRYSHNAWQVKRKRLGITRRTTLSPQQQTLTLPADDVEWWAYLRQVEQGDAQRLALATTQRTSEWFAPDSLPVGIVFTGDWHLGASGVDYARLDQFLHTVSETPGLYAIGMGDYFEGVSIHSKAAPSLYTGVYNDAASQEKSVLLRASIPAGRWLAVISGNHDEWCWRHTGTVRGDALAERLGCPHFDEGGGTVRAHVGAATYAIGVRHHFGGRTASVPRRMAESWPAWDRLHVAALAHLHFNELQRVSGNDGRTIYLRSGTAKLDDAYAKQHGFVPEWGTPMVILLPDREWVYAFAGDDFDLGLATLRQLRHEYRVAA